MMQWGKRQDGVISLSEGGEKVADFHVTDTAATALIDGQQWSFSLEESSASATNGEVTWTAEAPESFQKSKRFVATMGERSIDFINEQKSDWIIDENDVKLGQFTGAANGVRHVAVDFEPDAQLNLQERVFLAWLSRIALEQRLVGSTLWLSIALLITSAFALFVFFM